MISVVRGARPANRAPFISRAHWLGYAVLVTALVVFYLTLWSMRQTLGIGVDYADFRAASIVLAHGGNPFDMAQLWRQENTLYNVPLHLHPSDAGYYQVDEYRNPTLFAVLLTPLARLPFMQGFFIYSVGVILLTIAGVWLTLRALGWTRWRVPAVGIALVSPCVFLSVWYGQQSTLLLFAFGAALYALRRDRPGLAGMLLALGWVKPHLLIPIAVIAPLMLSWRACLRWYGGFCAATALGAVLTIVVTGPSSIVLWLRALAGYTGYTSVADVAKVDQIQNYLPSISGTALVLMSHPWNKLVAVAVMLLGVGLLVCGALYIRRHVVAPEIGLCVLMALWLLFTPYVHTNDDLLVFPALAVAWGRDGAHGGRLLPLLALWTLSTLSLAFLLPQPEKVVGLLPLILILFAAWHEVGSRKTARMDRGGFTQRFPNVVQKNISVP